MARNSFQFKDLQPEHEKLRTSVRNFIKCNVEANAGEFDETETFPNELIRKIAAQGYLGAAVSESYGGRGWDAYAQAMLFEEAGAACSSFRTLLTVHGMVAVTLERWAKPKIKQEWLPRLANGNMLGAFALTEADAGSDIHGIKTFISIDAGKATINGTKIWVSFGQKADLFLVFGNTTRGAVAVIVERGRRGVKVKPVRGLSGLRATSNAQIEFENVSVPDDNILGAAGFGLHAVAQHALDFGRYAIACGAVGIIRSCLERAVDHTELRQQFGKPLSANQLVQRHRTRLYVSLQAARLLCRQAAISRERRCPSSPLDTLVAKYYASDAAFRAAVTCVNLQGASGCFTNAQRWLRDAKVLEMLEGTREIHEILISSGIGSAMLRSTRDPCHD
jgi:glutaryl-CoA dehydrogenase (non-decarboxylating)